MIKLSALQLTTLRKLCGGEVHTAFGSQHNTYISLVKYGYATCTEGEYTGNKKGVAYLNNLDNPVYHPPAHLECCFCFAVNVDKGVCKSCGRKQNANYHTNTCKKRMTLEDHDRLDMGRRIW